MDKIVGKVKKQIEKAKIKRYFKKLIEILSLKELRILPAYLAYSFVLAVVPILTIIVIVAGFFSISIDSVISLLTDLLPSYASRVVVDAISGQSFDFSVGLLNIVTFCIAANGMYAIISASNSLYKIEETNIMIQESNCIAEYAVDIGFNNVIQIFENMDEEYMSGRARDIADIKDRIISKL